MLRETGVVAVIATLSVAVTGVTPAQARSDGAFTQSESRKNNGEPNQFSGGFELTADDLRVDLLGRTKVDVKHNAQPVIVADNINCKTPP